MKKAPMMSEIIRTPLPSMATASIPTPTAAANGILDQALYHEAMYLYAEDCKGKYDDAPRWVQDEYLQRARKHFLSALGMG